MATKANIKQPSSLDDEVIDSVQEQELDAMFLDQSIRQALPEHLIPYYERLVAGERVPARIKKQVRDIVTAVINNA